MSDKTVRRTWRKTPTSGLAALIIEFTVRLPGWWWYISSSVFGRGASCGPIPGGPDQCLLELPEPLTEFDCDDPNGSVLSSLRSVMKHSLEVRQSLGLPPVLRAPIGLAEGPVAGFAQITLAEVDDLISAIGEFERRLPGWWWYVATGPEGARAACGIEAGQDLALFKLKILDEAFYHADPNDTPASCLRKSMESTVHARDTARTHCLSLI